MTFGDTLFSTPDTATDSEHHGASPTARLLDELALYGYCPGTDEPDPRPLPEPDVTRSQLAAMFDAFATMLGDTQLEDDLADLLWSLVNILHRRIDSIERSLDDNEQAQRRSQAEQNGPKSSPSSSKPCPPASSPSPAPASPPNALTRHGSSAFRCGGLSMRMPFRGRSLARIQ